MQPRKASLLALLTLLGCAPRPSVASCEAMVEHLVVLTRGAHEGRAAEIAGEVIEEHRISLRDRCIEDGTEREVTCVLAAASLDAIPDCAPR